MALTIADLKGHANITGEADDAVLTRFLAAATKHMERLLGFTTSPTPADIELAILMLAAHWYENREATLVGVTAQELPIGVAEIVANYRTYTFGLCQ